MKIFDNPLIVKFMQENDLTTNDLMGFIGEIKLYLSNPDAYSIVWNGMVEITTNKIEINPGIAYLEEEVFSSAISINDVDYRQNTLKGQALTKMIKQDTGFYLFGNNGIGKTFLCVAFANHYYEKNSEKTLFVFWPDFIEKTKRFNQNNAHYINKVKYAKRLIIDDLGQESISQWSRDDILNSIIAFRLEKGLYTIVTSNYTKQELLGLYSIKANESKKAKAIVNKLNALAPDLMIDGRDLRKKW